MIHMEPATRVLTDVVAGVGDDQLGAPTPCTEASVGDLVDHVDGLSLAFAAAAAKTPIGGGGQGPSADASRLGEDWRTRIPKRLATLADVWRDEKAWTGMTQAGGLDLPGEIAGIVALDEVVVHGWDTAVASGQSFSCEPHLVAAAHEFAQSAVAQNPDGSGRLFGPPVPVPEDAQLLDRLLGLAGRDPALRPGGSDA
ncbi:MAG: TIGR03086 family metal-binding protein [Actinomycetota bacterium]|nr:TIGR03086 family metal-binding protein [Actinomycetota bacterium]